MNFNEYYNSLDSGEKSKFAKRLGTSKAYLSQINTGFRQAGRKIIEKINVASEGNITIQEMYQPETQQSA